MFSKNLLNLIVLDFFFFFKKKILLLSVNFWPTEFSSINFRQATLNIKLFFFDYFFFKETFLFFLKKLFYLSAFFSFLGLLFYFLSFEYGYEFYTINLAFYIFIVLVIFYTSLNRKSWLAYFLASLVYLLCIRGFYYYFTFKIAFCLWIISFFFVRELLKYIFNYTLFKIKTKYFSS